MSALVTSVDMKCTFFEQAHPNHQCDDFLKLSPSDRYDKAKSTGVCYNCLRKGHITSKCMSKMSCKICKKRHHSTLHLNTVSSGTAGSSLQTALTPKMQTQHTTTTSSDASTQSAINASCMVYQQRALLCTAIVNIIDRSGTAQPCRVLLDCGSQVNLLTEKIATLLQMKRQPMDIKIIGVDGAETKVTSLVQVKVQSRSDKSTHVINCMVMNRITGTIPANFIDVSAWPIPTNVFLADSKFNYPQRVDMLIGVGHFFELLKTGKLQLAQHLPYIQETSFGWVIGGLVDASSWTYRAIQCNTAVQEAELELLIQKFWESEEVLTKTAMQSEEVACEEFYNRTYTRDASGQYVVQLPFRENVSQLGDSRQHALQRFAYLEKKLNKDPDFKTAYCAFIEEYIELGHCRVVDSSEDVSTRYFLPHHAIFKPTSSTTKLRIVFDASAKTTTGISLNDTLMVGPTLQDQLFDIVLRFRTHAFVFTGDIAKMYRMVKIHPEHAKFQRFFWRPNLSEELKVVELTTVTYGTAAAPYLATRSLLQLAVDEGRNYPLAAKIISKDFYIDDVLTGGNTLEDIKTFRAELEELLGKGGFTLYKWCSNSPQFMETIPEVSREKQLSLKQDGVKNVIKTLGMLWKHTSQIELQRCCS
ncbi:uncharacterized protein LOC129719655 [Wyeomyia smithii]|uniref:uncharacterized protein LOC129719655 n=1 Tax=Wyeomyia smithii TaxID=174621 RepID=UPI002467D729|nr:uncharacterized protein LOC129719655 [Wyeomyia smithii]